MQRLHDEFDRKQVAILFPVSAHPKLHLAKQKLGLLTNIQTTNIRSSICTQYLYPLAVQACTCVDVKRDVDVDVDIEMDVSMLTIAAASLPSSDYLIAITTSSDCNDYQQLKACSTRSISYARLTNEHKLSLLEDNPYYICAIIL